MEKFNLSWPAAYAAAQEKLYTELPTTSEVVAKDLPSATAFELGYETALFDILRATSPDPMEVEIVAIPLPFTDFPEVTTQENTND